MSRWSDITHAANAPIIAWAEAQPRVRAMAACQQDARGMRSPKHALVGTK